MGPGKTWPPWSKSALKYFFFLIICNLFVTFVLNRQKGVWVKYLLDFLFPFLISRNYIFIKQWTSLMFIQLRTPFQLLWASLLRYVALLKTSLGIIPTFSHIESNWLTSDIRDASYNSVSLQFYVSGRMQNINM